MACGRFEMRFLARRLFLVVAVLAALAMLMAPAFALADDDDDDDGGGQDRAFCAPPGPLEPGQCSINAGTERFDFDASSGPLGENPTGTFRDELASGGAFFEVQVTCLQVTGKRASLGGTITDASNVALEGSGVALTVLDNTPAISDLISQGTLLPAGPPANTPNCGDLQQPLLVVTGDIVVLDNVGAGATTMTTTTTRRRSATRTRTSAKRTTTTRRRGTTTPPSKTTTTKTTTTETEQRRSHGATKTRTTTRTTMSRRSRTRCRTF
jgi:hypothetical protein